MRIFGFIIEKAEPIDQLYYRFSCILSHATGGLLSKTNYPLATMCEAIDEHVQREIEEALAEERITLNPSSANRNRYPR